MSIVNWLRHKHSDFRASIAKRIRTKEVVKVLALAHAQELIEAQPAEWALIKARQSEQIKAVMAGRLDAMIIDRRSWAYPYLPEALHRLNQPVLKNTPYNLRRFSETPIPRRAINLVKNSVLAQRWVIQPSADTDDITPEREKRIRIATECLEHPNNVDTYRTFSEAVLEDLCVGGYGCIEPRMTPDPYRPFKMWAVDGSTVRIFADWSESTPDRPRYAQMTGLKGERGIVAFLDKELLYIKDNVRSNTPFGLGKLEVAFNTIAAFLGAQDMGARAAADQVHKTMLWWSGPQQTGQIQTVRRYIQNELEGQQKIGIMAGMPKPEVIDIQAVKPEDLLLDWQQFLIKIIANAFDLSPIALGIDQHTNRATGQVMADADFRSAIVPMAVRYAEAMTGLLHGFMNWRDLVFEFVSLDDPDALTKTQIQLRKWQMGAITADEIREADGDPPLPAGWGRLTMPMIQLLTIQAQALLGVKGGGASGGSGQGGMKPPGGMSSMPGGMGNGSIGAGAYGAEDIAQMTPQDIEYLQQMGLLPATEDLGVQMEDEQPGILETLSYQLRDFFDVQETLEDESEVQPQKIGAKDKKEQLKRFADNEHQPLWRERTLQLDRKSSNIPMPPGQREALTRAGRQGRPGRYPRRGKYPRSGGDGSTYK